MVYPVRSHRCGGNSDSIADIVTTNCEKSAEVIVPKKKNISGRTEQFKTSIKMYVLHTNLDKRCSRNVYEGNPYNVKEYVRKRKGERRKYVRAA